VTVAFLRRVQIFLLTNLLTYINVEQSHVQMYKKKMLVSDHAKNDEAWADECKTEHWTSIVDLQHMNTWHHHHSTTVTTTMY